MKENGSLTCYDLQRFGNINPSKTYRKMKKLEQEGLLISKSIKKSTGRPKIKYFISERGEERLKGIKNKVEKYFRFLIENSIVEEDFDIQLFLKKTFKLWTEPVERIIASDMSITGRINALSEVENDLMNLLSRVRKEKNKLEKKEVTEEVSI
ncbi:MAG: hypothetical protein ACTSWY_11910 [Promethearchaeota archaeon]